MFAAHANFWFGTLGRQHDRLGFCYEAGPCGYGVHRQLVQAGHLCSVVAPSLIPRRAGDRVKTDRRDAVSLAQLHRAGELTAIWVPDAAHEAMRELVRARLVAMHAVRRGRQQLSGFLLRHGRTYDGKETWTRSYRLWLAGLRFEPPAQQIVLQNYIAVVTDAERRRDALGEQIRVPAARVVDGAGHGPCRRCAAWPWWSRRRWWPRWATWPASTPRAS